MTASAPGPSGAGPDAAGLPTRKRLLVASLELMRRHGYAGTGIKAILGAAATPYGSLYHHFPGGKEELGAATLRHGGRAYRDLVEFYWGDAAAPDDLVELTERFFDDAADFVASTDFADACPVATIAGEVASTSEPMRLAAAEAFDSWIDPVVTRLRDAGVDAATAEDLAVELCCSMEGAFLLARVRRDAEPVRIAGRGAARRVAEVIAAVETSAPSR